MAAIAFVNAASAQAGGASNANATISATSGNLLVAIVTFNANGSGCGASTISISDDKSNTWNTITGYISQAFNCSRAYYTMNIANGSTVVTANDSPNQSKAITVYQFSGADTSAALDSGATKSGTCAASPCTSSSFSTAQANEVILMLVGNYYSNSGAYTAGNIGGVASAIDASATSAAVSDGGMRTSGEYLVVSSVQSSVTAAMTITSSTVYVDYVVAAFKEAAGAVATGGLLVQGGLTVGGGLTVN